MKKFIDLDDVLFLNRKSFINIEKRSEFLRQLLSEIYNGLE